MINKRDTMQTKNEKAIKANGISEYVEIKDCKAIYKKKKEKEVARAYGKNPINTITIYFSAQVQ